MVFLSADQLKSYDDDGFIVLDVLTPQETEEISNEYDAVFKRKENYNLEATWGGTWDKSKEHNVKIVYFSGFIVL